MPYTTETFKRIYNDKTGEYLQIGPDADSLGLSELLVVDGGSLEERCRIVAPIEQMRLLAKAILELYPHSTPGVVSDPPVKVGDVIEFLYEGDGEWYQVPVISVCVDSFKAQSVDLYCKCEFVDEGKRWRKAASNAQ